MWTNDTRLITKTGIYYVQSLYLPIPSKQSGLPQGKHKRKVQEVH